jgi:hypothetical protein
LLASRFGGASRDQAPLQQPQIAAACPPSRAAQARRAGKAAPTSENITTAIVNTIGVLKAGFDTTSNNFTKSPFYDTSQFSFRS